jgi:hypothetical protein
MENSTLLMVGSITTIAMLSEAVLVSQVEQASAQDTDIECFNQPDGNTYTCLQKTPNKAIITKSN